MTQLRVTSVMDVLEDAHTPNPTIPVPYERFQSLGNSDDMLIRAEFWAFYAAWLSDKYTDSTEVGVKARHDGHKLGYLNHHVLLSDSVLMPRHDYLHLAAISQNSVTHTDIRLFIFLMIAALITGYLIGAYLR